MRLLPSPTRPAARCCVVLLHAYLNIMRYCYEMGVCVVLRARNKEMIKYDKEKVAIYRNEQDTYLVLGTCYTVYTVVCYSTFTMR